MLRPVLVMATTLFASFTLAGSWEVVSTTCTMTPVGGSAPPQITYGGSSLDAFTSQMAFSMADGINATNSMVGSISGDVSMNITWRTVVRYHAALGETVNTATTHSLEWANRRKAYTYVRTSHAGDYGKVFLEADSTGWMSEVTGIGIDTDGTLSGGVAVWENISGQVDGFLLSSIGGNDYEGVAEHTEVVAHRITWLGSWTPFPPFMMRPFSTSASYLKQFKVVRIDTDTYPGF